MYLVKGLPTPVFASMSSVKDSMSAIVLADDIDSSLLFAESDWGLPSKGFSNVG